jgi:hypothetical protein
MAGPLIDCYVLAPNRTAVAVRSFLNEFLPNHQASLNENDPAEVLGLPMEVSLDAILDYLEK